MPLQMENVLLELSTAFIEIDDCQHLPLIYHKILTKYLCFDWLGIFLWGPFGKRIEFSTEPSLSHQWCKPVRLTENFGSYTEFMSLPLGEVAVIEVQKPLGESDARVSDIRINHEDKVHLMGMATDTSRDNRTAIGIFRTDLKKKFTEDEKQFFMRLGPLFRSTIKMMAERRHLDLLRIGHDKIFESEKIQPLIVDLELNILSYPAITQKFLRGVLDEPILGDLPQFVRTWVRTQIIPQCQTNHGAGPWQKIEKTRSGEILCRADLFFGDDQHPLLIITFKPLDRSNDFHYLSKAGITQREIEVLSYLPLGYTNRQIALAMDISVSGVKKHLKNLGKKLDTGNRSETLFRCMSLKEELA